MLLEETIQSFLLAYSEFTRLDTRVVDTEERVDVVHRLCPHIGKLLDLGSGILDLCTDSVITFRAYSWE
jgi:hypothetical protein